MRLILASWALPLAIAAALATPKFDHSRGGSASALPLKEVATRRGVAYFEPPRSIGTPLEDLVRTYSGQALADRIAGRFRLESDASLNELARKLIRRRLAKQS